MMKNRFVRWLMLLAVGLGIGSAIGYYQSQKELEGTITPIDQNASILKAPVSAPIENTENQVDIGGPFTLTDQNGQTVTQDNYKDSYKLIFFGFTYCPAICPTELQKMTQIMDGLGQASEEFQPMLISVDPERDTPERLKEYVGQFHPKLVGLTGTPEQIESIKNAYRVYASKVTMDGTDDYMMDHSSFMYLMSPDGKLVAIYPSTDTTEKIIEDIKNKNL